MQRFEISAFLSGNCLHYGDRGFQPMLRGGSTYRFFCFWSRSPFCLRNGQWATLSRGAFRSGALECWRYFCSAVSVIRHNQALSPRVIDHKPGTPFITATAKENRGGTRRRRNSFESFEDEPGIVLSDIDPRLFECAITEAICGGPHRR